MPLPLCQTQGVSEGALQFVLYERIKREARQRDIELTSFRLFWIAAMAKLVACTATYPHEVVRTRLRCRIAQNLPTGPKYKGLWHTFRVIAAEEGVRGLYAGLPVHLMKVVPNAALIFCIVEYMLDGKMSEE